MTDYPKFNNKEEVNSEFILLNQNKRDAIQKDLGLAINDSDLKAFDYYNRIGKGNLSSYADCLLVQQLNEV